jgi:hypothetical protein
MVVEQWEKSGFDQYYDTSHCCPEWPAVHSGRQAQVLALAADWHVRCDADRYGLETFLVHHKVASYLSWLSWMVFRLFLRALALRYCYLRPALFWDITHRTVTILFRSFGFTYQSHVQGQEILEEFYFYFFICLYFIFFPFDQDLRKKFNG